MTQIAHVVAVAARTPVGLAAEPSAAAIRAGVSRLMLQPHTLDARREPVRAARDARLAPALLGAKRVQELASLALTELLRKLPARDATCVLAVAFAEPRPGIESGDAEAAVHRLEREAGAHFARLEARLLPRGHAGALAGIAHACDEIGRGSNALFLVGGADSYFASGTFGWLESEGRLRVAGRAGGFSPGEGAAFVALTSASTQRALGLRSLARVLGAGEALEPRSWDDDVGPLGEGIAHAIRAASTSLRMPDERIDDIYNDLNGERLRNDDWGCAVLRVPELFVDASAYTTAVAECGDLGAASGALSCVLAVEAIRRADSQRVAHAPALVCGSSWNGLRAACLFRPAGEEH